MPCYSIHQVLKFKVGVEAGVDLPSFGIVEGEVLDLLKITGLTP